LKHALFHAYFTQGKDISDHSELIELVKLVGLDIVTAKSILDSTFYSDEVRYQEHFFQQHGINSVPAIVVNDQYLISGAQTIEVFEHHLKQILEVEPS